MRAIILAAGQGRRLWPCTKDLPKCLLEVGRKTILEHQVEALHTAGVKDITVVSGYCGGKIQSVLGNRVRHILNADYQETSSMYSLWLARDYAEKGCVILNGDVLFHIDILKTLWHYRQADALAVDFDSILAEEEMKVAVRGNRVEALSKGLARAHGENVGMLKFSAKGCQTLFKTIEGFLYEGKRREMVPFALNEMAPNYPIAAVSVNGLPWIEIDFPEDLRRAREVIYPAMKNHSSKSTVLDAPFSRGNPGFNRG